MLPKEKSLPEVDVKKPKEAQGQEAAKAQSGAQPKEEKEKGKVQAAEKGDPAEAEVDEAVRAAAVTVSVLVPGPRSLNSQEVEEEPQEMDKYKQIEKDMEDVRIEFEIPEEYRDQRFWVSFPTYYFDFS
jgi:hypothetical protein